MKFKFTILSIVLIIISVIFNNAALNTFASLISFVTLLSYVK